MKLRIKFTFFLFIYFALITNAQQNKQLSANLILKISYSTGFERDKDAFFLLQTSHNNLKDYESLRLAELSLKVMELVIPRTTKEYLFCCEAGNTDFGTGDKKLNNVLLDSLRGTYKKQYDKYFGKKSWYSIDLNTNKSLTYSFDTLDRKYKIQLFKVDANFCICEGSDWQLSGAYTDTVANLRVLKGYQKFSKTEKNSI